MWLSLCLFLLLFLFLLPWCVQRAVCVCVATTIIVDYVLCTVGRRHQSALCRCCECSVAWHSLGGTVVRTTIDVCAHASTNR